MRALGDVSFMAETNPTPSPHAARHPRYALGKFYLARAHTLRAPKKPSPRALEIPV
jgi:hypothetical protein